MLRYKAMKMDARGSPFSVLKLEQRGPVISSKCRANKFLKNNRYLVSHSNKGIKTVVKTAETKWMICYHIVTQTWWRTTNSWIKIWKIYRFPIVEMLADYKVKTLVGLRIQTTKWIINSARWLHWARLKEVLNRHLILSKGEWISKSALLVPWQCKGQMENRHMIEGRMDFSQVKVLCSLVLIKWKPHPLEMIKDQPKTRKDMPISIKEVILVPAQ